MRRRPRPRARRTSSSTSRSSLKMSCWNSYDVISIMSMDVLDRAYERQRELHGGLRIVGHWILLQRSWWGEMKVWGWFARKFPRSRNSDAVTRSIPDGCHLSRGLASFQTSMDSTMHDIGYERYVIGLADCLESQETPGLD